MKKKMFFRLVFVFVVSTFAVSVSRAFIAAEVKVNFEKGKINVYPKLMNVGVGTGVAVKRRSFGINLNFGDLFGSKQKASENGAEKNTYFVLEGNPDDLAMHLLTFGCSGPYLVTLHSAYHKFAIFKGRFEVRGLLASSQNIVESVLLNRYPTLMEGVPQSYVGSEKINYFCTDEFRKRKEIYRLPTLGERQDMFSMKYSVRKRKISVRWDPSKVYDPLTMEFEEILKEIERILEEEPKRR